MELASVSVQIIHDGVTGTEFSLDLRVLYAIQGRIEAEVENKYYRLSDGGMLIINPFTYHKISSQEGSCVLLRISQDMLQAANVLQNRQLECYIADDSSGANGEYDQLRMHFARVFKLYSQDSVQNSSYLMVALSQLLSVMEENFLSKGESGIRPEEWESISERYTRIMRFIHENWREDISINMIAKKEFLSSGYLSRFFKKHVGITFSEYLKEIRLQNAEKDLLRKKGTITEIALSNGFKNVNAFIKSFRDSFGVTPKKYQNLALKNARVLQTESTTLNLQSGIDTLLHYAELEKLKSELGVLPAEHHRIDVDVRTRKKKLQHTWKRLVNIGYARDGLLAEVQSQLRIAQKEIGFEYIRFHGILDDDMHIYHETETGEPYLDFSRVDLLLDFILSINMKPFIELSFMPSLLSKTSYKLYDRQSIFSAYSSEERWRFLIKGLVQHCVERYGRDQVALWRFTTMGSHAASLGAVSQEEYLDIYRSAYESVKSVDPRLLFGGPGGFAHSIWDNQIICDFFEYAKQNHCLPDFVCTQNYPHRAIEQDIDFLEYTLTQYSSPAVISGDEHYTRTLLMAYRKLLDEYRLGHLEIWLEEWNSTLWQRDISSDTCYKSSWLVKNLCENYDDAQAFGYWLLTDFMEERSDFGDVFHGGYGLFTYNGIPKSGWHALRLMRELGNDLVEIGDGWMVTRSDQGVQIVLTHYCHYDKLYRFRYQRLDDAGQAYSVFVEKGNAEYSIRLNGLTPGRYEIQKYSISREQGSSFDAWMQMGAPQYLRKNEIDYLKNISQPQYHVRMQDIGEKYSAESTLSPHEIQVILLKKTEITNS